MAINFSILVHTQYGVDIAISEGFRDAIKEVERFDDRQMKLSVISVDRSIQFFTAYAQQTGRPDVEKDAFWQFLEEKTFNVPAGNGVETHMIDFAETHVPVLMNT